VFVIGRQFPDSFARNVAVTLRSMGLHVGVEEDARSYGGNWKYLRAAVAIASQASPRVRSLMAAPLRRAISEFRPDLVLALTTSLYPEETAALRSLFRGPLVLWFADTPANSAREELIAPQWDLVFLKDRDVATRLAAMLGDRFRYLPEAMNPMWHRPTARVDAYRCEIGLAGNSYPYRFAVLERLGQAVTMWGPPPAGWLNSPVLRQHTGEYVAEATKAQAFSSATVCLNTVAIREGNSANCRCFEIAGCGGFQVMEHRPIVSEYFEPDREILLFRTLDELREQVRRGLTDATLNRNVREAAARRALGEHTYEHRLRVILAAAS
jgi:spore maturation protein CgeB